MHAHTLEGYWDEEKNWFDEVLPQTEFLMAYRSLYHRRMCVFQEGKCQINVDGGGTPND